jgi:hypothetical protein
LNNLNKQLKPSPKSITDGDDRVGGAPSLAGENEREREREREKEGERERERERERAGATRETQVSLEHRSHQER